MRVVSAALAQDQADAEHAGDEEDHEEEAREDDVEVPLLERVPVLRPDGSGPGRHFEVIRGGHLPHQRKQHHHEPRHGRHDSVVCLTCLVKGVKEASCVSGSTRRTLASTV